MPTSVFLTYSLPAGAALSVASVTASGAISAASASVTGDLSVATVTLSNGGALRTDTTTGHTALIQAYDVDGAAYATFATLTNGNSPSLATLPPGGGATIALSATTYAVGATAGADINASLTHITTQKGIVTASS